MHYVPIAHNSTNNKQLSRQNRISPSPGVTADLQSLRCHTHPTRAVRATYLHLLSQLMRTQTSQKCVFNEPPPSAAATTRKNRSRQLLCSGGGWKTAFKITSSSRTHLWCLNGVTTGCWITHINGFGYTALFNPRSKPFICTRIQFTCKAMQCRCA